ncbi:sensor histidine kinase [Nesterenkonia muleiensis]|uniref:sensor histidine kinase n=1 Tax=Nesterenkonia muleiensis TaxID=2282648 RepID=UPI003083E70C
MVGVLATYGRPAVRQVYALVALAWLVSQFAGLENVQVQVLGAMVVTGLTVLAYAIGRLVRSLSRDRDRSRSELTQAESSLAEQRSSLARELHDNAVSDLTVIVMKAQRLQLDQRDPQVVTELDSVLDRATLTIDRIGRMVTLLRDNKPIPETDDLVLPSIPESLQHFEDELSNSGIPTTVESTTGATTLGPSAQVAFYHILKEAVTNVIKYGARSADGQPACHIRFAVEGDRAELCVLNQINQERQRNSPALGIGLEVLRERAEAYGAEVSVGPDGSDHWRLHVTNMRTT